MGCGMHDHDGHLGVTQTHAARERERESKEGQRKARDCLGECEKGRVRERERERWRRRVAGEAMGWVRRSRWVW